MKVLVTGGAGFIGSHVVEHFQGKAEVIVLDNFRSGHRRNLAGLQHTLIEGSILDRAKLDDAMRGVDQVYHLAAMISVPESMLKPRECVDLNATGTLHVLEAAEASSQLALESTQRGYRVGVRVNLDVLNAQSLLFQTRRDLAKARYDSIVGSLRLRQAAGTLGVADVQALAPLLGS